MVDRKCIKEVLVVEGRDDQVNLSRFVEANFILTHGFALDGSTLNLIIHAAKNQGVIIFTDPDFAGNVIRRKVVKAIRNAQSTATESETETDNNNDNDNDNGLWSVKHAYISEQEGTYKDNIGVENASGEAILRALENAKAEIAVNKKSALYSERDMYSMGLVGGPESKALRIALGQFLSIGYGNGKQFLQRLNAYQVPYEKVAQFLDEYGNPKGEQHE